jgi:O-antigen/teichoic acid export membrane protein
MRVKTGETSQSIFKNVLFGFSTWILPLGLSFVATPIIVRNLGNAEYGIYALVLGFVGYSFNFNLGRAITKYIAEYRISGETEKLRDVISSTFFLNLLVGALGVLTVCFSAEWLVINVLRLDEAAQSKSVTALYIAALIIFATSLNQVFNSIIQGIHRHDVKVKFSEPRWRVIQPRSNNSRKLDNI